MCSGLHMAEDLRALRGLSLYPTTYSFVPSSFGLGGGVRDTQRICSNSWISSYEVDDERAIMSVINCVVNVCSRNCNKKRTLHEVHEFKLFL